MSLKIEEEEDTNVYHDVKGAPEATFRKNLRFGLSFFGIFPVPIASFVWLAAEFDRYMNTFGWFILLFAMESAAVAGFWFLQKIESLWTLAVIGIVPYLALYLFVYRKL